MRRIGLTGGIATGKSHVAARLREHGIPVVDADVLSRDSVASGSPGLAAAVARFGQDILHPDGSLDRSRLGDIVFRDLDARRDLEAIVHPAVYGAIEAWFATLPAMACAVADIPLLYETGREGDFDAVVVTACAPDEQLRRLMARDGLSSEAARQRIEAQLPLTEKVRRADHVICTDGSHAETDKAVDALVLMLSV